MIRLIIVTALALLVPQLAHADEVIQPVDQSQVGAAKNAFGKAIAESKAQDSDKDATDSDSDSGKPKKAHPDNFGGKVSAAAHQMKADGTKQDFGKWVSSQRSHRPDDAGKSDANDARGNSNRGNSSDAAAHGKGRN